MKFFTGDSMTLSGIPFVGWILDIIVKACLALPFWMIWSYWGLGEKYFAFLPKIYLNLDFWDCLGLFIAVPILYAIFIPKFVSVSQSNENNHKASSE